MTLSPGPWDWNDVLEPSPDLVWDDQLQSWIVSSYDDLKMIARDDETLWETPFILREERPGPVGLTHAEWSWYLGAGSKMMMSMLDGDRHRRQHGWLMRMLSPKRLENWKEALIRPAADRLIDRFLDDGNAELNTAFADLLAPRVIAAVMDLPQDDDWIDHISALMARRVTLKLQTGVQRRQEDIVADAFSATRELHEILLPFVEERRLRQGSDLVSQIWRDAETIFDQPCDAVDVLSMAMLLWEAGSHSTLYSTSNGLYLLASDPALQRRVRAGGRRAVKSLAEEALRLYGPVSFRPRIAKRDVRLGSVTVRRGEQVLLRLVAANRDGAHYRCPAAPALDRPSPTDHFAFFRGARTCPGQALARAELTTAAECILSRTRELWVDEGAEPPRFTGRLVRRWEPLHVEFTPA